MLDNEISREKETAHFWKLTRFLADAKVSGDANALWEALDDLDVLARDGWYPAVRAQAARVVAQHGFVPNYVPAEG